MVWGSWSLASIYAQINLLPFLFAAQRNRDCKPTILDEVIQNKFQLHSKFSNIFVIFPSFRMCLKPKKKIHAFVDKNPNTRLAAVLQPDLALLSKVGTKPVLPLFYFFPELFFFFWLLHEPPAEDVSTAFYQLTHTLRGVFFLGGGGLFLPVPPVTWAPCVFHPCAYHGGKKKMQKNAKCGEILNNNSLIKNDSVYVFWESGFVFNWQEKHIEAKDKFDRNHAADYCPVTKNSSFFIFRKVPQI